MRHILFLVFTTLTLNSYAADARYFIKFKNETKRESINEWIKFNELKFRHYALTISKYFITETGDLSKIYGIYCDSKIKASEIENLRLDSKLEYIEENPTNFFFFTPNDIKSVQYYLTKINAVKAWDSIKGSQKINVAVIDDAIETNHSDLKNVIWKNTNETPGNGIDDDKNGYIDDIIGWDAADNDNDPNPPSIIGFDHGTHCAGIAGAETNNNNGIASIGHGVTILPIKISSNNTGMITNAAQGLEYAIINKASVISMSWGGTTYSKTYQLIFDLAAKNDIICVAAAGNSSTSTKHYPAAYNHVIAVASTTSTDVISNFSTYGNWIDVCAPGSNIYSTITNNSYGYKSGTSMACPLVSGLCALMRSRNPNLSASYIESCLKNSCDNIDNKNSSLIGQIGSGRINAENAIICIKPLIAFLESSKTNTCPGDTILFRHKSIGRPNYFKWEFPGGKPSISYDSIVKVVYSNIGIYDVKLSISDGNYLDSVKEISKIKIQSRNAFFTQKQISTINGNSVALPIRISGIPPFSLTINNGTSDFVFNPIDTNYYSIFTPTQSTYYKLTRISDNYCTSTLDDSIKVNVISGLNCSKPQHYYDITHRISGATITPHSINWWNGDIIVSGMLTGVGAGSSDAFVARFNDTGKLRWLKTIGGSGAEDVYIKNSISPTGKILLTYRTKSFNNSYGASVVTIIDTNGNIISQGESKYNGKSLYECYNANFISKANRFVATGLNAQYSSSGKFGISLDEFDSTGNVKYQKVFTSSYWTYTNGAAEAKGGYIIGGDIRNPDERTFLMKTNKSGSLIWSYKSNSSYLEKIIHVKVRQNGDIIGYGIAIPNSGFGNIDLVIHYFDSSGNIKWSKLYGGSGDDYCGGIEDDGTGIVFIAQTNSYDGGRKHKVVIKIDYKGTILWSYLIGNTGKSYEYSAPGSPDLAYDDKSGLIIYAEDVNAPRGLELINLSNCGESNCNATSITVSSKAITISFSSLSLTTSSNGGHTNINQNSTSLTPVRIQTCRSQVINEKIKPKKCRLLADFKANISCFKDSVIFYDNSKDSNNQKTISRLWDFGDGLKSNSHSSTILHKYNEAGTYNVTLVVTTSDTNVCIDTITKMIRVIDTPIVKTKNGARICKGDSFQLGIERISCLNGRLTYKWTPSTGLNSTEVSNPKASPLTNTVYSLLVTDETGISLKDTVHINIDPFCCRKPTGIIIPNAPICEGNNLNIVAKPDSASGISYKWTLNDKRLSNINDPFSIQLKNLLPGSLKVKCLTQSSCGKDSLEVVINVNTKPNITIIDDTTICKSGLIGFKATPTDLAYLKWSSSHAMTILEDDSITSFFNSSGYVAVMVTDRYTNCQNNDTAFIILSSHKNIFEKDSIMTCEGDSILVIPNQPYITWNDGHLSENRWLKNKGTYIASINNNACIFSDTIMLITNPLPLKVYNRDTSICAGDSAIININSSDKVLWFDNLISQQRTFKEAGSYTFKIYNDLDCYYNDTIQVVTKPLPDPNLGNDTFICKGKSLTISSKNHLPGWAYLWDDNSKLTSRLIQNPGKYHITITSQGCLGHDTINVSSKSLPSVFLGPDSNICNISQIDLLNLFNSDEKIHWDDGSTKPKRQVSKPGKYWLSNANSCGTVTDTITIFKKCDLCEIHCPNSFTPYNRDKLNDIFKVYSSCQLEYYRLSIYNKWGQEVFRSHTIDAGWDGIYNGHQCALGNYVWIIDIKFKNNEEPRKIYRGNLIIIGNE